MSVDLWVSIAVAIPLAIIANIATPKIQRWLDSRASLGKERKLENQKSKRENQLKLLKVEFSNITELVSNPAKLTNENFITLLKIALYGAFGTLYGGLFSVMDEFGHWEGVFGVAGRLGAQVTALFVSMLIFLIAIKALRVNNRVNKYEKYKMQTEKLIAELERDF